MTATSLLRTSGDEITPAWMQEVLAAGSEASPPPIARVVANMPESGFSGFGDLARCRLYLPNGSPATPEAVIVKSQDSRAVSTWFARQLSLYEREYMFYRHLAEHIPIRAPALHFGCLDIKTYRFVLVLEDLGRWGRPAAGADGFALLGAAEAWLVIRKVARMHGQFWNAEDDPRLRHCITVFTPNYGRMMRTLFWYCLVSAREYFPDTMTADMVRWAETLGSGLTDHLANNTAGPRTFVHGDLRASNLFFSAGATPDLALIDWQGCGIGNGLMDLAYFIVFCVDTPVRRSIEQEVLEEYHTTIVSMGAQDFTFEDCRNSYRRSMFTVFMLCLLGCSIGLTDPELRTAVGTLLHRSVTAIHDLDAMEFLPDRNERQFGDGLHASLTRSGYTAYLALQRLRGRIAG